MQSTAHIYPAVSPTRGNSAENGASITMKQYNGVAMHNHVHAHNNDEPEQEVQRPSQLRNRIVQTVVDIIVIAIIFIIFAIVYFTVETKIRHFTCDESDIFLPYKPDTVPFWAVGIFGALGPLLFIFLVELVNAKLIPFQKNKRNLSLGTRARQFGICTMHAISLFILGIAITLLLTEIGKRWVGRLRPHFIAVCKPNWSSVSCTSSASTGVYYNAISTGGDFCTGSASDIKEARFSFPSGHSSFSWYTMTFLIIYLEARLCFTRFRYVKPLIQMTAFIAAFVTCLSRISDYHHRGSDVIGGTVLGIVIAFSITLVIGRVLWDYQKRKSVADFDLKKK